MIKYLRWQIPFSDMEGTRYVIDIYANTPPEGGVEVLVGASGVMEYDEATEDNVFTPIRTKTATVHIINNSGLLSMIDSIAPSDNTKRFARLWLLNENGEKVSVEWQGFLSSDSFTQAYTNRPASIDISLNSMLAAMDDVECKPYLPDPAAPMSQRGVVPEDCMPGVMTFKQIIDYTLKRISERTGLPTTITDYYVPQYASGIMDKKLNTYDFFKTETRTDIDGEVLKVRGVTLKEVIERICGYMNWTARESGREIYLQDTYDPKRKYERYKLNTQGGYDWVENVDMRVYSLDMLNYRGVDHTKQISRGAKVVEVKSKMTEFDQMSIPEMPYSMLGANSAHTIAYQGNKPGVLLEVFSQNGAYYSHIKQRFYKATMVTDQAGYYTISNVQASDSEEMGAHMPCWPQPIPIGASQTIYSGALLARMGVKTKEDTKFNHKMQSGVFCPVLAHNSYHAPVLSMSSARPYKLTGGYLNVRADMLFGYCYWYGSRVDQIVMDGMDPKSGEKWHFKPKIGLRIGDWCWAGGDSWIMTTPGVDDPMTPVAVEIDGSDFKTTQDPEDLTVDIDGGLAIKIPDNFSGEGDIEIAIYPQIEYEQQVTRIPWFVFYKSLRVDYIRPFDHRLTDRNENAYSRETLASFDETVSEDLEIATDTGNMPSPSIVLEPSGEPMQGLQYDMGERIDVLKPEQRKLACMEQYYSAPRRQITLEVEVLQDPLPMLVFTDYEGRTYLPLSESVDVRARRSTLTLYEVGPADEDSDQENTLQHPTLSNSTESGGESGPIDTDGDGIPDYDREDYGPDRDHWDGNEDDGPDEPDQPDPEGPDVDGPDNDYDGPDYDGPDWDGPDGE